MEQEPKLYTNESQSQISFESIEKRFGKILVHSLPNGNTFPADEKIPGFTTNPPFEIALDKCLNEELENLCCSSVSLGDGYNRWGGSPFGLYMLDGIITACFKSDGHSWHKPLGETQKLPSSYEIIKTMRNNGNRGFDEIQVRTKPDLIIPYLDLDLLVRNTIGWGFDSLEVDRVNRTCKEELERYQTAMKDRTMPMFYLYRGKIGKLDIERLYDAIEPIKYGYKGRENDDKEFSRFREKCDSFKEAMNTVFQPMSRDKIIFERGKISLEKLKAKLQKNTLVQ
jgi:hypothetical protein